MKAFPITWRTGLLWGTLLVLILAGAFFHRQISRSLAVRLLLNSESPREEFFHELAKNSDDPVNYLSRCWATGKIAHRQLVAAFLKENAASNPLWFAPAEPLVLAGAVDGDASVRELALAALEIGQNPRLFEFAAAQLEDLDPLVRLLGLDYLRKVDPQHAVPMIIRLLDDPDLRVVAGAEIALMRWSGEDFGVRTRLSIPTPEANHPSRVDPANAEIIQRGVERRKAWWNLHAKDYPAGPQKLPGVQTNRAARSPVSDFKLKDMTGRTVHLTQFRGKVVLLNFWATWCTACLAEIPDLVALQNKLGSRIAIVGVALDGAPDEHDDAPGQDADHQSPHRTDSLKSIRAKVARAVKSREINYTILLDSSNSVGGRFNGGELPTTVIIDPEGRICRRFIGERNLKVFEEMVAAAAGPIAPH